MGNSTTYKDNPLCNWLPGRQKEGDTVLVECVSEETATESTKEKRSLSRPNQTDRSERSVAAVTKRNHTLRLFNIVPELSGSYKCKVSSLIDEDFKQMDMLVYCEYDTKAKK